jgi:hypothetical protein
MRPAGKLLYAAVAEDTSLKILVSSIFDPALKAAGGADHPNLGGPNELRHPNE